MSKTLKINRHTSPTICPLPFLHTYVTANGTLVACCEAQETPMGSSNESFLARWNSEDYKNLRQQLINGEQSEICKKCWKNEASGISSNRQDMWDRVEEGAWGQSSFEIDETLSLKNYPSFLELKISNLCNLKCRMCHPSSSHRINEDKEIIEKYRKDLPWRNKIINSRKTIQDLLSGGHSFFDQLEVLQFSGGEPLISDEHLEILDALLSYGPEKFQLRYSTNLTRLEHNGMEYLKVWKKFKSVNIKISLDGLDELYNYIRAGADFDQVLRNILSLKEARLDNMTFSIGFTTQAYNVFQLPEFLNFFEKIVDRKAITTHLLHSPELMSPAVFPNPIAEKIARKLRNERKDLNAIADFVEHEGPLKQRWPELLEYTRELDAKAKIQKGFLHFLETHLAEFN